MQIAIITHKAVTNAYRDKTKKANNIRLFYTTLFYSRLHTNYTTLEANANIEPHEQSSELRAQR